MALGIAASAKVASAPAGPITGLYQTNAFDETDLSTYTFVNQPIGVASATRRVVVGVTCRHGGSRSLTSVTIGGIAATIDVVTDSNPGVASNLTAFASAVVPTGTTADIVVVYAGGAAVRCGIGVWALSGGTFKGSTIAANTDPTSFNLTTVNNDFVVFMIGAQMTGAGWTGATERFDIAVAGGTKYSGADTVATGTSVSVDVDMSGTVTGVGAVAARYS